MRSTILIFLLLIAFATNAKVLDGIYAVVNDEIITHSDINLYLKDLKANNFVNDMLFANPAERKRAITNREYLIKKLIDERIVDSEIKKLNIVITPGQINKEIGNVLAKKQINQSVLKQVLKKSGKSIVEYQDFIKKSLERRSLIGQEIQSKLRVSEEDIIAFYVSQKGKDSSQIYEFSLQQMTFEINDKQSEKEAMSKAKKALNRLKGNDPFEKVAAALSDDPDGVDFGTFKAGEMRSEIEQSVVSLKRGEYSEVTKTPLGFQVFRMQKKSIIDDPELNKQKGRIQQILLAKAYKEHLDFWLSRKRSEAAIRINKVTK